MALHRRGIWHASCVVLASECIAVSIVLAMTATPFPLIESHAMAIRARQLTDRAPCSPSYFRVQAGKPCEVTFEISDNVSGAFVDWSDQAPRFRVYSQVVDRSVVMEITDEHRCTFRSDGIWRLQLTADETDSLPRGGMRFTLEHREADGDYRLGLQGGISCCEPRSDGPRPFPDAKLRPR